MSVGKLLILIGIALVVVGVLWTLGGRVGLGRLPGTLSSAASGARSTSPWPPVWCSASCSAWSCGSSGAGVGDRTALGWGWPATTTLAGRRTRSCRR